LLIIWRTSWLPCQQKKESEIYNFCDIDTNNDANTIL
jgi:hypothetical protein